MRSVGAMTAILAAALQLSNPFSSVPGPSDPNLVLKRLAMTKNAERDLVKRTVEDVGARDRLLALYDERDRLVEQHVAAIDAYRERMEMLDADYQAVPAAFEAAMTDFAASRTSWREEFFALLDAMKRETTAKEWKTIADFELRKFKPRELDYPQPEER